MRVHGKIQKWGNSLGIRIQKVVAEQAHFKEGSEVDITVKGHQLIVTPASPRYTLKSLMAGVKPENLHGEVETGPGIGIEEW